VIEHFKGYYKQKIGWNALSFLGGSNLIGNPVNFLNTLGTGVKDFYYEPVNGFMRGPREGAHGLVRGTGSLVKNTFVGSVGSLGKISSSLSAGMLAITGDDEFMMQRNRGMIKQRPTTVMQGIEQGVGSALSSGWSGLKGVIEKPNEGYRQEGTPGFFKGALKGAAGLFVKPLTGAMDLVTKTSEGISNANKSPLALFQDTRMRQPRAFYDQEHIIREFDHTHANLLSLVPRLRYSMPTDPGHKLLIDTRVFYNAWILEENSDIFDWHVLFLTQDMVFRIARFSNKEALSLAISEN